jgi:hypothetical protein
MILLILLGDKIMKIQKKKMITFLTFLITAIIITNIFIISSTAATADEVYQHNLKIYNSQGTDSVTLEYYKLPQNGIESDAKEIIDLAKSITSGISKDYDKIKAIHDWVANNFYYDWDKYNNNNREHISAVEAMYNKRTVCEGYVNTTVALLRSINIPAKYISGYTASNNNENHAWCEAFADGRWIILDSTWDSNNSYKNGVYEDKLPCDNKYFDISLKDFSATHEYREYSYVGLSIFRNNSSLINVSIPNGFTAIEDFGFRECANLTSVKLPDSIVKIGWGAFYNCENLQSINIPNSVKTFRDYAFSGCKSLTSINIPNGITGIGECTFQQCIKFTEIVLPNSVRSIGDYAFSGCANLKSITMPFNITSIGERAFWGCGSLSEVTLPPSVTSIGKDAFDQCVNLTIYGEKGSLAEKYAKDNKIPFVEKTFSKEEPEQDIIIDDSDTPLAFGNFYKVGDPIGDVVYSDITAYINGYPIPTSVIKGVTLVVVEDLAKYGFNVNWDGKARTLKVTLNKSKKFEPLPVIKDTTYKPGTFKCKYLYTDIKTYISGQLVNSYAIQGVTLMDFELLAKYGKLAWDGKTREIKLTIN